MVLRGHYCIQQSTPRRIAFRNRFNFKNFGRPSFGTCLANILSGAFAMGAIKWKLRLSDETGQVLVIAALSMTVLLGFVGLATDVGVLFCTRRTTQSAADAAAVAGALDYLYNGSSSKAIAAGKAAATANGVTDGTGSAVVTISVPAADGPNAGTAGYIE